MRCSSSALPSRADIVSQTHHSASANGRHAPSFLGCCAQTASGHAAAPPITPRTSRRFIGSLMVGSSIVSAKASTLMGLKPASLPQNEMLADVRCGVKAGSLRSTPRSRHRMDAPGCPKSALSNSDFTALAAHVAKNDDARCAIAFSHEQPVAMSQTCQ